MFKLRQAKCQCAAIVVFLLGNSAHAQSIEFTCQDEVNEDIVHEEGRATSQLNELLVHNIVLSGSTATIRSAASWTGAQPPLYELVCAETAYGGILCTSHEYGRVFRFNPAQRNFTYTIAQPGRLIAHTAYFNMHSGQCEVS